MSVTLYGLKNCDTCRKALRELEDAGIGTHFFDIRSDGLSHQHVAGWVAAAGVDAVLNKRLEGREFIVGDEYTIADMACFPWIRIYAHQGQVINDFPALKSWLDRIADRPAVQRALDIAKSINTQPTVTEDAKSLLFNQSAQTVSKT